jgi:hypothetical protein
LFAAWLIKFRGIHAAKAHVNYALRGADAAGVTIVATNEGVCMGQSTYY